MILKVFGPNANTALKELENRGFSIRLNEKTVGFQPNMEWVVIDILESNGCTYKLINEGPKGGPFKAQCFEIIGGPQKFREDAFNEALQHRLFGKIVANRLGNKYVVYIKSHPQMEILKTCCRQNGVRYAQTDIKI